MGETLPGEEIITFLRNNNFKRTNIYHYYANNEEYGGQKTCYNFTYYNKPLNLSITFDTNYDTITYSSKGHISKTIDNGNIDKIKVIIRETRINRLINKTKEPIVDKKSNRINQIVLLAFFLIIYYLLNG